MEIIDIIIYGLLLILIISLYLLILDTQLGYFVRINLKGVRTSFKDAKRYKNERLPIKDLKYYSTVLFLNGYNVRFKDLLREYEKDIDLNNVAYGLIEAKENNLDLTFSVACIADSRDIDIKKTIKNKLNSNVG